MPSALVPWPQTSFFPGVSTTVPPPVESIRLPPKSQAAFPSPEVKQHRHPPSPLPLGGSHGSPTFLPMAMAWPRQSLPWGDICPDEQRRDSWGQSSSLQIGGRQGNCLCDGLESYSPFPPPCCTVLTLFEPGLINNIL